MSKLICRDIHIKYFGHDESVCGFSAEFSDGFNVIFGAEKSGKTTLLKGIAGLIGSEGDVFLDETDVRSLSMRERDFAFVFDDYGLFSRRTVRYNLEYPLKIRGVPKEERRRIARESAALFDLEIMIDCPVYKLNEWHKVALALCRAYLRNAAVLFIDNVFAALDLCTRKEAFYRFMPLFTNRGIVVYATDSVEEAAFLSDKVQYLNCGYLLQEGSVAEFRSAPSCVAAFESFHECVSVLPATLTEEGLLALGTVIPFDLSRLIGENYVGTEVYIGLRAEDVVTAEEGIPATIVGKFYSDNGYMYSARSGDAELYLSEEADHPVPSDVHFVIRNVFTLFDPTNERAIVRY